MSKQSEAEAVKQAQAIQRRGHHGRLMNAIARFRLLKADPETGQFATALAALAAVEAEMIAAGQEP